MKNKNYWILIGTLAIFALIIHLFSSSSIRVEHYYSTGIYPFISIFLWYLFGWLPFSIGDILYGVVSIWLLLKIARTIKSAFRNELFFRGFITGVQRLIVSLLLIYIIFNVLWGINYNRKGIASQLGLTVEKYTVNELKTLNGILLRKVNASSDSLLQKPAVAMSNEEIFIRSLSAYKELNKQYSFLNFHPTSVKKSLWGWLGNYFGFLGYYNPFTGEGQINTNIPRFLHPFTNCHEIAHQLGYAKENEANFVGYLAAASSEDLYFHYSAYLEIFLYANHNLFYIDSVAAISLLKELHPAVKKDLKEWQQFISSYENPFEPVIKWIYGKYLENNQQPSGMLSYDEVTGFLIAYYKKSGNI